MGIINKIIAALLALIAGPFGLPAAIVMMIWAIVDIITFMILIIAQHHTV